MKKISSLIFAVLMIAVGAVAAFPVAAVDVPEPVVHYDFSEEVASVERVCAEIVRVIVQSDACQPRRADIEGVIRITPRLMINSTAV